MGYFTRVLTTKEDPVPLEILREALEKAKSTATLVCGDKSGPWREATLVACDGQEIALLERNPVCEGSLGDGEMQDFEDALEDARPKSSAEWLRAFFTRVRCIYSFQHLQGAHPDDGFTALQTVRNAVWACDPAIIQADGEGFTNEDGYHILWQFSDKVTGSWWMGLLQDGAWVHFQMDLGNPLNRKAFLSGNVPDGAILA